MGIEVKFREFIRKKSSLRTGLRAIGSLYGVLIACRHWAYDHRWLRTKKASVPVISIGNIVVGGTGKTPFVCFLAKELSKVAKLAILSRGYRSKKERAKGTLVTCTASPLEYGDEPCLLAQKFPEALVIVGKDRSYSAQQAVKQGAELILLDDGMQHRKLARDFEIVVMDAQDLFGQKAYLPGGLLRDSPKRLKNAHLIVATHLQDLDHYEAIKKKIALYTAAPVLGMQLTVEEECDFLRQKKVGLFCAIGNPDRFVATIERLGGHPVDSLIANDHRFFSRKQLESFAKECREKGAELLVCTEKDWVKIPAELRSALPICPIKVELTVIAGHEHYRQMLEGIAKLGGL